MKLHSLFSFLFLLQIPALAQPDGGIRVIDEHAIPYMEFLSKADFDQRFPGQVESDPAGLDSGWYVIYAHEHLNYYFGPILLESTGQDYLAQLTKIVEAAVEQRPDIQGFQLSLSYEPSTISPGNSDDSGGPEGDREGDSGVVNEEPSGEPPQPSGFWGFIRRTFGF